MPAVTAAPRGMSNGDVITSFIDSAETTSRSYTYPTTQSVLLVGNKGKANITVTVNATPYVIQPDQSQKIVAEFTSFSIVSSSGVQHFEVAAVANEHKSTVSGSVWNSGNLLQLGTYRFWVDSSGRLRIKNGVPTSDTDGTIVGAQV